MASYIFGGDTGATPESLKRQREIARALAASQRAPRNVGEGLSSIGNAIAYRALMAKADKGEAAGRASAQSAFAPIVASLSGGGSGAAPAIGGGSVPDVGAPADWENIQAGIFAGESGGDYDALFGFSNRPGGEFSNVSLTDMTVDEALAFADPSGPYGQWVKGKVGRVATPMGAYQTVGTTLGDAKAGLGLSGNERMTPDTQDAIGKWILANQGTGAWEGYKGPQTAAAPTQVAQAGPSVQQLLEAAGNPFLSDTQQAIIQTLLGNQLKDRKTTTIDDRLVDSQTGQVIADFSTPDAPNLETLYDEQTGLEYKGAWNAQTQQYEPVAGSGTKAPSGTQLRVNPETGEVEFQQGAGLKPLTEGQSKDTAYVTRAAGALPKIDELGNALTSLPEATAGDIPLVGNYMKTPEYRQAEQAGLEFLQAILRKDTGAAITPAETAEYGRVYLPRPGDDPETLAQKKRSRARAVEAIKLGMPPAAILALETAGVETPGMPDPIGTAPGQPTASPYDLTLPEPPEGFLPGGGELRQRAWEIYKENEGRQ